MFEDRFIAGNRRPVPSSDPVCRENKGFGSIVIPKIDCQVPELGSYCLLNTGTSQLNPLSGCPRHLLVLLEQREEIKINRLTPLIALNCPCNRSLGYFLLFSYFEESILKSLELLPLESSFSADPLPYVLSFLKYLSRVTKVPLLTQPYALLPVTEALSYIRNMNTGDRKKRNYFIILL